MEAGPKWDVEREITSLLASVKSVSTCHNVWPTERLYRNMISSRNIINISKLENR